MNIDRFRIRIPLKRSQGLQLFATAASISPSEENVIVLTNCVRVDRDGKAAANARITSQETIAIAQLELAQAEGLELLQETLSYDTQ